MKTPLLILALAAASLTTAAAQTKPAPAAAQTAPAGYQEMLGATIQEVMSTGDAALLKELAGKLERAATVAPQDWLPRYYQSYALLIATFQSKESGDVKDKQLDQAEAALQQARQLGGDASELLVLQAYIYQARLGVAPMTRSMTYSGKVDEALAEAKKLNPANPRIYLVQGNNLYFTPKMFGGGTEAAKPVYDEAKARYAAFKPATPNAPSWGERQLLGRLAAYQQPAGQPQAATK
ncbi:hypothetical protein [Hymenobacter jeollabukensis]|uniref:Tetratricopeptide repeat protein n=1 Tax=Hymenobacter jeollabukensis TaxID=2025313 RepID=A0A5R8WJP5_9BACT|nr:hypothetical protein [Hymenobacter jeollabukensis]TLM89159.1 hypothetical protein FDY95_21555 [Hymenobacter jeollabukensis]